jgi:hypothetical protein
MLLHLIVSVLAAAHAISVARLHPLDVTPPYPF